MAWELFRREGADGLEMIGVDALLLADAPLAALPIAVEVSVTNTSVHPDVLAETEGTLESLSAKLGGRLAGVVRSATNLWTLVYLPSDERARQFSEVPLPRSASIWVQPAIDPDWRIFDRVRPVGMEEQSMYDLGVMRRLHAAGDRGGERRIDHVVASLAVDAASGFVTAAKSVLVDAQVQTDSTSGTVTVSHLADPTDITTDAWTLRQIGERHGGRYEGWTCEVAGAPPPPARKRRRFRR
ncbi:MAG: hypothetical protein AB8G26_10430 [Ilumatobacter sp.]